MEGKSCFEKNSTNSVVFFSSILYVFSWMWMPFCRYLTLNNIKYLCTIFHWLSLAYTYIDKLNMCVFGKATIVESFGDSILPHYCHWFIASMKNPLFLRLSRHSEFIYLIIFRFATTNLQDLDILQQHPPRACTFIWIAFSFNSLLSIII